MTKRILQIATAVLALVPLSTGFVGLYFGTNDPLYSGVPANVLLDTNLRFFSGVWLALGVAMLWLVPRIAEETTLFRALWAMIFVGGVGRLASKVALSPPPAPFIGFTALEIVGAPLFIFWQSRIAER
ncbi:MAG: DUF4345 domain-containing protein [Roseiarcus sp.]